MTATYFDNVYNYVWLTLQRHNPLDSEYHRLNLRQVIFVTLLRHFNGYARILGELFDSNKTDAHFKVLYTYVRQ